MAEKSYLDETLDINQTSSYHLSIQSSLDGFSFAILDTSRNKYIALKDYPIKKDLTEKKYLEEVDRILGMDEFLTREFKSVYLMHPTQKFTLVPTPLFHKDNLKMYFEFNQVLNDLDELHFSKLKNADAYMVHSCPSELANLMTSKLKELKFYHQGIPLIESMLSKPGKKATLVHVDVHPGFIDVVVTGGKKLNFYNTFHYSNEKDLLYFIMLIFEQLKLNQEDTELVFSGMINKDSNHFLLVKRYVKRVAFMKPNELYTYSYTFEQMPVHRFGNLLNLYPCVS
jgi:hypothetical protein